MVTKQLDVLLVNPPSVLGQEAANVHGSLPPIGLSYLAKALQQHGYSFQIVDMSGLGIKKQGLLELLDLYRPRIVGITSLVNNYYTGLMVAALVKERDAGTKVVVGGPHATFLPAETLRSGHVDVVALYEGEETIVELAGAFINGQEDLSHIRGIAFMQDGQTVMTERRDHYTDLITLGAPVHEVFDYGSYNHVAPIVTGRGCPYGCIFCVAGAISGRKYRIRPIDDVIEEIVYLMEEKNTRRFFITDDTFTFYPERVEEFCAKILERKLDIQWKCEGRVNTITRDLMVRMRKAGCSGIQFGVESANPEVLKLIKKQIDIDQVREAVQDAHNVGLTVKCSFIIGLPHETEEMVRHTIEFAKELHTRWEGPTYPRIYTAFAICTPLPGTYLYENAEALGITFLTKDWNQYDFLQPVMETRHLKREQLTNFLIETFQCWSDELET